MATSSDATGSVDGVVGGNRDAVEAALVSFDREALADLGADPDAVVAAVFTPAFVDENTDFPDMEAFLAVAGAEGYWALEGWLDWVEYRCEACGDRGRATHTPDGAASLEGLEGLEDAGRPS